MTPTLRPEPSAADLRRLDALESVFPILFVESTPGSGAAALIDLWAAQPFATDFRMVLDAEKFSVGPGDLFRAIIRKLGGVTGGPPAMPRTMPAATHGSGRLPAAAPPSGTDTPAAAPPSGTATPAAARSSGADPPTGRPAADPFPPDLVAEFTQLVSRLRGSLTIAVTNADALEPVAFVDLLEAVIRRDTVQLIIAGFDCTELMDAARGTRLPYARIDDRDLALRRHEIAELLAAEGITASEKEVAALHRHSGGLIGAVLAAIDGVGISAAVANPGDIGAYLFTHGVQHWPVPLVAFIKALVHVPRFTLGEAAAITKTRSARLLTDRMITLGMGRMTFYPSLRQRVFTWHEVSREVALGYLEHSESPTEVTSRLQRTVDAAWEVFDLPLAAVTQVQLGRLDRAEGYLRDWLWDCLPNEYQPLWRPLLAVNPAELVDYPRLLALRVRVEPRDEVPPAVARAVAEVMKQDFPADPWARVGHLALAVEFAQSTRDALAMVDPIDRARGLVLDLIDGTRLGLVTPSAVSDLLLIADATFRLGNHGVAGEFAGYARDLIDAGSYRVDPWGERRSFAARIALVWRRECGLPDPAYAQELLAAPQFRWRDTDIVAQALAESWDRIDAGDLRGSEHSTSHAISRVVRSLGWPALWYQHVWILGFRQERARMKSVIERYRASLAWVGIPRDRPDFTPSALSQIGHVIDEYLPAPIFLSSPQVPSLYPTSPSGMDPTDDTLLPADYPSRWSAVPRWEAAGLLLAALDAARGERFAEARNLLTAAVTICVSRPVSPTVLVAALPDEIRLLGELISTHPFAASLQLDQALAIAGQVASAVQLSEREGQVLQLLRQGMTNKQIAAELFLSVNTAKFHRGNLMRKLEASSRQELLEAAARLGL